MIGPRLAVEPPVAIEIGGREYKLVNIERAPHGLVLFCSSSRTWHSIPLTSEIIEDLGWTLTTALLDAVLPTR